MTHGQIDLIVAENTVALSSLGIVHEQDSVTVYDRLKESQEVYGVDDHHVTETYVIENGKVVDAEECVRTIMRESASFWKSKM